MRLDNSNIRRELPLDSLHEEEIRYLIDIVLFVTYALVGASHMGFLLFNHHQVQTFQIDYDSVRFFIWGTDMFSFGLDVGSD